MFWGSLPLPSLFLSPRGWNSHPPASTDVLHLWSVSLACVLTLSQCLSVEFPYWTIANRTSVTMPQEKNTL